MMECRDLLPSLQQGVGFGIYINIGSGQKYKSSLCTVK